MDIQIPHSWLLEHLETKASPEKIGECLSLCGPSVEKITKDEVESIYHIEITTNRIDTASVYGIAREAATILPEFGISAKLKEIKVDKKIEGDHKIDLKIKPDPKNVRRVMAVVIKDIKNNKSPQWMIERLQNSGLRSINLLVDITNYIMLEYGHPTHVFDYDKLTNKQMLFRLSKPGEDIITLDSKKYKLPGGDIVIDEGSGTIIDIPGIMGTKNSSVSDITKNIVFFVDNINPIRIRKTSLSLNIRSYAVILNEKSVDPKLAEIAFYKGIELYASLSRGVVFSKVFDYYKKPISPKPIQVSIEFIEKIIGIKVEPKRIVSILQNLGFSVHISRLNLLRVAPPSWRQEDVTIPEDIVEEVARIIGYHNLPSKIMNGEIPEKINKSQFEFENLIRNTLVNLGGYEVYTSSLTTKSNAGENALQLRNPLGSDTEYLRTTLKNSLVDAANTNTKEDKAFHLFEIANVYLKKENDLPDEKMMLAGVIVRDNFRNAKGIVETFLESINSNYKFEMQILESNIFYYEFDVLKLSESVKPKTFKQFDKYQPQIEDMTFTLDDNQKVGDVISKIYKVNKLISNVELVDIYESSYTFRIFYQSKEKTLTNSEVEKIREKVKMSLLPISLLR